MMQRFTRLAVALAMAAPATPFAATQPEEGPAAGLLEEVIVTARKREEDLQSTPIAISAYTAEAIEARGLQNLPDITQSTPSLIFNASAPQSNNPAAASVFLRGVGQLDFTMFTDPGVGIYVDGVYIARSVGSVLDFIDVERVEVLRGPQGTLFGRNTIGGAINLVAKQPTDTFGADVAVTTGSDNRLKFVGNVNVPLADTLAMKLSGYYHQRDGYVKRLLTGEDLGDDDALGGRLQLAWRPSDAFTANLAFDATRRRENMGPGVLIAVSGTGFTASGAPLPNVPPPANPSVPSVWNHRIGGVCDTAPDSSQACYGAAWLTGDPYTDNGTFPGTSELDILGSALTLDWDLGPVGLKSITAYRDLQAHYARETDHTAINLLSLTFDDRQHQFSQEFQLTGELFGNRVKWLAGTYYFAEKGNERFININNATNSTSADINIDNENYALFGEATWDLTDRLHLTGGVRWTDETKKFQTDQIIIASAVNPALVGRPLLADNSEKEKTFSEVSPRITLAFDLMDDLLTYVTYSEGFKSGGFNGRYTGIVPPPSAPIPFDPEYVKMYEVGFKYTAPARNFRLNAAVFRSNYEDIQVNFRPDPTQVLTVVGNAAEARIEGVELETTFLPIDNWTIEAGGSYMDANYTKLGSGVPTGPGLLTLNTPLVNTPEWMLNASTSYKFALGSAGFLTPRIDWSYRSEVANDNTASIAIIQDAFDLVNASITYTSADDLWRVTAGGTNLTDEPYLISGAFNGAAGLGEGAYARPREWYLSLKRSF